MDAQSYTNWVLEHDTLSDEDRCLIRSHLSDLPQPLISVVMPTYETAELLLREAIASVQAQIYPNWELCIADDASPSPHVCRVLEEASAQDRRIRWTRRAQNGHISAATNTALALAKGEFVALMDHDDLLPEHALYEIAVELAAHPDADVIYSDEDNIDETGQRTGPYFKPMWSPELLAGHNMISHFGVYRRALLEQLGGLREGFEGSQDWDLALRATAATTPDRIRHVPSVLYHWRRNAGTATFSEASLQRCIDAGRRAVHDWLSGEGMADARVISAPLFRAWSKVVYPLPDPAPLVSVVISARDRATRLGEIRDAVFYDTEWPFDRLQLLVVDNLEDKAFAPGLEDRIQDDPRSIFVPAPSQAGYSQRCNLASRQARGDILVFLDDDIDIDAPNWLAEMVGLAMRPQVGAVGAKLVRPDGRVRHSGFAGGPGGHVGNFLPLAHRDEAGYFGQLALTRSVLAVSGACMAVRREVWEEIGGLDDGLIDALSEIDFCLRLQDHGYRIVWTPDAILTQDEDQARRQVFTPNRLDMDSSFAARWRREVERDPYHNPNVSLQTTGTVVPVPPRRRRAWRR